MAVKYLAVIYRDGKEIDRWPAVEKKPNHTYWIPKLDILLMRNDSYLRWFWLTRQDGWVCVDEEAIPKTLRLLALLE